MTSINKQYDEIITSHPRKMKEAILFMEKEMARKNCKFGKELLPTFLKPVFLSEEEETSVAGIIHHIKNILEKVSNLYFTHKELREYFYIDKAAEKLIRIDPGYKKNVVISRPDSFLINNNLRFLEFNCDSPAGSALTDTLEEIFLETFPFKELAQKFKFHHARRLDSLLSALLGCYEEFAGKNKKPNIAIIDWKEVKTQNEFKILKSHFKKKGYDTVIADPRELKFYKGRLEYNGFPIDLVYRRVIFKELMEKIDEVQSLIEAYRKGKVCIVNPLRSRLASNKATLAIMTDQKEYKHFFTEEENRVIHKHIPWTRRVVDMQIHYQNNLVFLLKHIRSHKDGLVLKPADSYGGRGVTIGCETPSEKWTDLIERIILNKEDWVVQKYVDIVKMTVPEMVNGTVKLTKKKYNLNQFIFGDQYAGSMARLSDQSVINVSAGGGLIPVTAYENL